MAPRTPLAAVAAVPVVVATLALAGCSGDSSADTDPAHALASMPGVRAATVSGHRVVVDADRDATADQVADVLRAVRDLPDDLAPDDARLYLGAGTTDPGLELVDWKASLVEATGADARDRMGAHADQVAALLVHLADTAGPVERVVQVEAGTADTTIALDVPGAPPSLAAGRVESTYLEAVGGWGTLVPDHVAVTAYDRSGGSATQVAALAGTASGDDRLESLATDLSWIASDPRVWYPSITQDADGARHTTYALSENLDPTAGPLHRDDDDALWSLVSSRLAPLSNAGPGSTYAVSLVDAGGEELLGYDPLFTLTLGADGTATPGPDPDRLGWGEAAAAVVNAYS